jgi:LmbE family N-acetylglucosaminyl deacetylase
MRRILSLVPIAGMLAASAATGAAGAQTTARTIVAVLAHPDDEGIAGPALARYARERVQVHLIYATSGEQGTGGNPEFLRAQSITAGAPLAAVRTGEVRCAATALGANPPILLGFPDGKLGDYTGDRTTIPRLTERIAVEIRRLSPDALITWGPEGGTSHPDHRIVSSIVTQLVRTGAPGATERLFYMYLPAEAMAAMNPQRGAPQLLAPGPKHVSTQVSFTPADLVAARRALECHRSQYTAELVGRLFPFQSQNWNGRVSFSPAFPAHAGTDLIIR